MRTTESRLDLAASHAVTASLVAHRSVSAWDPTGRVELTDDVRVTLSGLDAAARLQSAVPIGGWAPAVAARPLSLIARQASGLIAAGTAPLFPSPVTNSSASVARDADMDADLDLCDGTPAQQAWLLLLRLAGDDDGATRLAARLAAFARRMHGGEPVASTLDKLASQHAAAAQPDASTRTGTTAPPATQAQAPVEDWGYREDVSASITETESTSFAAAATVTTADGRTIDVAAAFQLVRTEVTSVSASVRAGAAARDPLVLSLDGRPPALGGGSQRVDIDADGTAETVASLAAGSGYLVRDLNGNGRVDSGAELFGPETDDGFAELAALDQDGSGWVDEGDAAFAGLSLWSGVEGAALRSLDDAGVGALATGSIATPYAYGATTGSLAAAGIFLYEDGRAGIAGELRLYA